MFRSRRLELMAEHHGYGFVLIRMWHEQHRGKTVIQAHRAGLAAEIDLAEDTDSTRAEQRALAELDLALGTSDATAPIDIVVVSAGDAR